MNVRTSDQRRRALGCVHAWFWFLLSCSWQFCCCSWLVSCFCVAVVIWRDLIALAWPYDACTRVLSLHSITWHLFQVGAVEDVHLHPGACAKKTVRTAKLFPIACQWSLLWQDPNMRDSDNLWSWTGTAASGNRLSVPRPPLTLNVDRYRCVKQFPSTRGIY